MLRTQNQSERKILESFITQKGKLTLNRKLGKDYERNEPDNHQAEPNLEPLTTFGPEPDQKIGLFGQTNFFSNLQVLLLKPTYF